MRRVEREARVVEKPFVPLMPHKQYNSREQPDKRMRKRSSGYKLLFRHRDGWRKDVRARKEIIRGSMTAFDPKPTYESNGSCILQAKDLVEGAGSVQAVTYRLNCLIC